MLSIASLWGGGVFILFLVKWFLNVAIACCKVIFKVGGIIQSSNVMVFIYFICKVGGWGCLYKFPM